MSVPQLFIARPAGAVDDYFAHTEATPTRPPVGMAYRMGDYAESQYFGPIQGVDGVWTGVVNYSSAVGFGRWSPGTGAPRAVFDPAGVASKLLATPVGYELLMSGGPGSALNETSPMAVWRPVPPAGYTALGSVVTPSASTKPRLEDLRVLRNDCVAQCPAFMLWCNVKMPGQCPMFNPAMPAATTGGADWSTAVYTSGADGTQTWHAPQGATATNLLFVEAGSSNVLQSVPCLRTACLDL